MKHHLLLKIKFLFLENRYACPIWIFIFGTRHTVFRFVSTSAKFGICTVVGKKGALVEAKISTCITSCAISASTSVPFRLTTAQMTN